MKRIKILVPAFLLLGTLATLNVSCSNDEALKNNESAVNTNPAAKPSANSTADNYVKNFYNTSYTYGRSVQAKEEDGTNFIVD